MATEPVQKDQSTNEPQAFFKERISLGMGSDPHSIGSVFYVT